MTNKLPKIMEKQRHHYWEGIILDKSWQPGPKRRTTLKSTFGPQASDNASSLPSFLYYYEFLVSFTKPTFLQLKL
jgi:hypothetical protein